MIDLDIQPFIKFFSLASLKVVQPRLVLVSRTDSQNILNHEREVINFVFLIQPRLTFLNRLMQLQVKRSGASSIKSNCLVNTVSISWLACDHSCLNCGSQNFTIWTPLVFNSPRFHYQGCCVVLRNGLGFCSSNQSQVQRVHFHLNH